MKAELYKRGSWCYVKPYNSPMMHVHKTRIVSSTDGMGNIYETTVKGDFYKLRSWFKKRNYLK